MKTETDRQKKDRILKARSKTGVVIVAYLVSYLLISIFSSPQWFSFNNQGNLNIMFILNFVNLLLVVVFLYFACMEIGKLFMPKSKFLQNWNVCSTFVFLMVACLYLLLTRSSYVLAEKPLEFHFQMFCWITIASIFLLWIINQATVGILYKKRLVTKKYTLFMYPFLSGLMLLFFISFFYVTVIHTWFVCMLLLAISILSDVFGYAIGINFGKHKMAPKISPKKSWEGLLGSYLITLVLPVAIFLALYFVPGAEDKYKAMYAFVGSQWLQVTTSENLQPYFWAIYVSAFVILITASILGDLFFSNIKRRYKVKDFSNLLPGHGGILDRFDALSFTFIVFFVVTVICQLAIPDGLKGACYLWRSWEFAFLV